ncbi:hypothetical protein ACFQL4_21465 [Halosimplex aquaticum]
MRLDEVVGCYLGRVVGCLGRVAVGGARFPVGTRFPVAVCSSGHRSCACSSSVDMRPRVAAARWNG